MSDAGQAVPRRFSADARLARELLRGASFATLATLDRTTGHPLATLVQVATLPDARPCILISTLAQHTQNLLADSRASVLVDQRASAGDMTAARVTIAGQATHLAGRAEEHARQRFLGRHPSAESYAAFGDFGYWALSIERAYMVAGFGRIRQIEGGAIELADMSEVLADREHDLISQLQNEFAGQLVPGASKLVGLDIEGLDVLRPDGLRREAFSEPALTIGKALSAARLALQQSDIRG